MKHCEVCKKTSRMVGTRILLRGHYNPTNWSRKYPNLQKTTTPGGEKVFACTGCIRTFGKAARIKDRKAAKAAAPAVAKAKADKPKVVPVKKAEKPAAKPKKAEKKEVK